MPFCAYKVRKQCGGRWAVIDWCNRGTQPNSLLCPYHDYYVNRYCPLASSPPPIPPRDPRPPPPPDSPDGPAAVSAPDYGSDAEGMCYEYSDALGDIGPCVRAVLTGARPSPEEHFFGKVQEWKKTTKFSDPGADPDPPPEE